MYTYTHNVALHVCIRTCTMHMPVHVCIHTCTCMCTPVHFCSVYNHPREQTQIGWTMTPSYISVESCIVPVGPLVPSSCDPLAHFFTNDILSLIVRETNQFAAPCLAAANSTGTWETNLDEIKAYLGFMIVMGVNRLPEIRDYWSVDSKLNNTFISSRITRKRFEEISQYLHFIDNTTLPVKHEPGFHRLQKVMPIITAMREKFEDNYNPHPHNSIDEVMIPFKGTCTLLHIHAYLLDVVWYFMHTYMYITSRSV